MRKKKETRESNWVVEKEEFEKYKERIYEWKKKNKTKEEKWAEKLKKWMRDRIRNNEIKIITEFQREEKEKKIIKLQVKEQISASLKWT